MLTATAAAACAACLCGLANPADVLAADAPTTAPSGTTTLDAGPKSNYKEDGITDKWIKAPNKVAIIRHEGKLYAITAICTHKGGNVAKTSDTLFTCPLHKATYDVSGAVTKGPAKVALNHFAISVNADGNVIVDKTKTFDDKHWDDPASFIALT
jgi:nitrite reductase/ring-hydroxylating ferredoxin subunit